MTTTTTQTPTLLADWTRATVPHVQQNTTEEARQKAESQRARTERLKDPFMPIVRKEPAALKKETILWEDDEVMVIVDAFAYGPKALVIPKMEVLFPTCVDEKVMQKLSLISARVSDAFIAQGAKGAARMWVNPPSALTVRQLHVHVQPGISRPGDSAAFYQEMKTFLKEACKAL